MILDQNYNQGYSQPPPPPPQQPMEQPPMDYGNNYSGGYGNYEPQNDYNGGADQVTNTSVVTENGHWWQSDTQVETNTCKLNTLEENKNKNKLKLVYRC